MLKNYIKISYRNLVKRKGYFFINLIGLTIGMVCCLFIFHYVSYERSYDNHIQNSENKYRLRLDHYLQGVKEWQSATVYPAIGPTLKRDFPEVKSFCRLIDGVVLLWNQENDRKFSENKGYFSDQDAIPILNLDINSGNKDNALVGPHKIIVSETMAKKYFGTTKATGKILTMKQRKKDYPLEVTGVFKDFPNNSHLDIKYLVSLDSYRQIIKGPKDSIDILETLFDWYDFYTYIEVQPGTNPELLASKFPAFCKKYMAGDYSNKTYDEMHLIPVKDIHLNSNYNQEAEVNGNGQMVAFLFLIGVFIIFIAWINYINLSTARSVERAKEVGIKKVLGAFRFDLIKQFLIENIILNCLSLILALIVFFLLYNKFDTFCGREIETNISLYPKYWLLFAGIILIGTLLSGIYPAIVLSGFQPVKVLKGSFKNSSSGINLRRALIIIQFTISVILISGTIVVYKQVNYMRNKDLGASLDKTIVLSGAVSVPDSLYRSSVEPFKNELLQNPAIKTIAASSRVPGQEIYWVDGARRVGTSEKESISIYTMAVDFDFVSLYEMKIKAGRSFSKDFQNNKNRQILINEKASNMLGFKNSEEAVNKLLCTSSQDTAIIVGVLANYHHQGLQKEIDPMMIPWDRGVRQNISIKFNTSDLSKNISFIESVWKNYYPNDPFEYFFLDQNFEAQYKTDVLFEKVFGIFSLLAILIACSGMLGLSAYNVLQRSKEIGVRKILGASSSSILLLLSKDFIILIGIALVISIPLGWYAMNLWLQDFAYRITISWWIFLLAGFSALMISLITIILHAHKSIKENPVKNLRTE